MGDLDTSKSLIKNSDYLKKLALELDKKEIKDIDSNLLYEVAYADTYLDILLSKSTDKTLDAELLFSKSVFDTILSSVSYDKVDELKSSFDYKKLLRCKYDDIDKASYDKSYAVADNILIKSLKLFISNMVSGIISVIVFYIFTYYGIDFLLSLCTRGYFTQAQGSLINIIKSMSRICANSLVVIKVTSITIDTMYICLPFVRSMIPKDMLNGVISKRAIKYLEDCMGETVVYKSVKDYNRIERNKVWLESMLGVCDKLKDNTIYKNLIDELIKTKDLINSLEIAGHKGKGYYLLMAKIEFLHDKYLELVDK